MMYHPTALQDDAHYRLNALRKEAGVQRLLALRAKAYQRPIIIWLGRLRAQFRFA